MPFYLSDSSNRLATFQVGEKVQLEIPNNRKLVDMLILRLTPAMVVKPVSRKNFTPIKVTANKQLKLPMNKGYHLIVLKVKQLNEIQTYTGMIHLTLNNGIISPNNAIRNITKTTIEKIRRNMTYNEILNKLGSTKDIGSGLFLASYIVDGKLELTITFSNLNDKCPLNGAELLKTAKPM